MPRKNGKKGRREGEEASKAAAKKGPAKEARVMHKICLSFGEEGEPRFLPFSPRCTECNEMRQGRRTKSPFLACNLFMQLKINNH